MHTSECRFSEAYEEISFRGVIASDAYERILFRKVLASEAYEEMSLRKMIQNLVKMLNE